MKHKIDIIKEWKEQLKIQRKLKKKYYEFRRINKKI